MVYEDKIELDNDQCIALIDVAGNKYIPAGEPNSNIVCLDKDMNLLWRISAPVGTYERDSFVELTKENDGTITARRFYGNKYTINSSIGEAIQSGWQK